MRKRTDPELRFHQNYKIIPETNCWIWQGALNSGGYGNIAVYKTLKVSHRYSYEIHKGEIPDGYVVRHNCDNPSCVNPNHLILGTQKENMNDARKRGRNSFGMSHYRSKLSTEKIETIFDMWEKGYTSQYISKILNMNSISSILCGKSRLYLKDRIEILRYKYPYEINSENRMYWKRSTEGWKIFKRRPINEKIISSKVTITHICKTCAMPFHPKRKTGIYCSNACGAMNFRERNGNSDNARASRSNIKAKKYNAEGLISKRDIKEIFKSQDGRCKICNCNLEISGYHLDHKISLSKGGTNLINNLQLLCPKDNMKKS